MEGVALHATSHVVRAEHGRAGSLLAIHRSPRPAEKRRDGFSRLKEGFAKSRAKWAKRQASHSQFSNSSASISASFRILFKRPGPIISPARTGTTVRRPSGCCRKWWLPLIRKTMKPARRNAAITSRPHRRGKRGIFRRQCAARQQTLSSLRHPARLPGTTRWPRGCAP